MGAVSRCKSGAADAPVADWISEKESLDAPTSGATSACRSVRAPAPGADAPSLVHFGITTECRLCLLRRDILLTVAKPRELYPHHLPVSSRSSSLIHVSRARMDLCARSKSRGWFL